MSRLKLTAFGIVSSALLLSGCSDQAAQAHNNNAGTRAQIRESMGNAPTAIDTTTAVRLSAAFRGASEQALPSVVHIRVTTQATARRTTQRTLPFPFFDDNEDPQQPRRGMGTGSGFVFDGRGYILTNNHVVENAERVLVTFVDGREYTAQVIGSDPQTDVGVIKIEPRNGERFAPVSLGSSDDTHVGDWVIALGNPLNLQFTVTAGIVSAKGRALGILERGGANAGTGLESFIQTDAAINPGNSGGPLIDLRGRVVGINSAIESPTGFFAGAGFAIPIDLARKVAGDIIEFGHVRRPRLGVEVGPVSAADAEAFRLPAVAGAVMRAVTPGQPAARAGIEMG
ncbi:MAG TPA: trypsin-like peptidase domain-containing protein, partial [Longimicrobiales bacterium]